MRKMFIKKILAVLMILVILSTDFYVLGSNLITYALTLDNTTNNKNIEFTTYFQNERGEKVDSLQTSIKATNLKLFAEVTVKNDGYLNATLELQNSNFNIKNNILSDSIAKIENNIVTLNQINAGETAKIELDIEPIILDTMATDMLLKASDLKLTGKYMETSYKGLKIEATRAVSLDLQADTSAKAELETDIITNKEFSVGGTNKRVIQLKIKSRLSENQYPVKQTIINVDVPVLSEKQPENVSVLSLGTLATNGETTLAQNAWENKDGKIKITLTNDNTEIKWNKDVYDELVVTYIYDATVDASKIEILTESEITVHNSGTIYTAKYTKGIENKELNGVVTLQSQINTSEMYKGQLYANADILNDNDAENDNLVKDVEYNTTTTLVVTNADLVEKVTIHEGPDVFTTTTENEQLSVNTKYVSTKINKEKMLAILGQDGNIEIRYGKDENEKSVLINQNTETNDDGNIVINYETPSSDIYITSSNPKNVGMLEINHSKAITQNTYDRTQLKKVTNIKTKNTVEGSITKNKEEKIIVENIAESSLELKETMTKAELTVNKESLSTMIINEDVKFNVKLITDGMQYDLYKDPTIKIQLPSSVEHIEVNSADLFHGEGFVKSAIYNKETKIIEITLTGAQKVYPEVAIQLYLQLNLDITLSKLAPNKMDKIVMMYTNKNATQYDGGTTDVGVIEKNIEISSPSGLLTMHNSDTYNITGIKGTSEDKQLVQISNSDAGKEINFDIALVNNTDSNLKNVRIFGKLPTAGNKITGVENANTLSTNLKDVTAANATIYYSENVNATTNVEDTANGWTTTLNENAKVFLIKLDALNVESNYTASYKVQLPNPLVKDAIAYTEYEVVYDTDVDTDLIAKSVAIGFATPTEVKMETKISAQVGNDVLNNGDTVKAGEVIIYTMTVKNTGVQTIQNVQLKSNVPEGTVLVEPEVDDDHSGLSYYEEKTDVKEMVVTVPEISAGGVYTATYEVRVKSDLSEEKQISNKTIATCEETTIESTELATKIVPSNIRVTVKEILQNDEEMISGGYIEYLAFIENTSNEDITNLELELISTNFKPTKIIDGGDLFLTINNIPEKLTIEKIPAKGTVFFMIDGKTTENAEDVSLLGIVKDSSGNTYRSNKIIDVLERVDAKISLSSPQDKAEIKTGDTVIYDIIVENTGNIEEYIKVVDNVPENLQIETVYVNGEIVLQSSEKDKTNTYVSKITNNFSYTIKVAVGNRATMKIVTKVKYVTEDINAKTITNKAEAVIYDMIKATTEEVTHILKLTVLDIKNVITGKAWLDENRNGAKDASEKALTGINVKLYDILKNDFAKNNAGKVIETTTNDKGEYSFTKIKNGKYLVLFEYDVNEYEPTFYLKDGVDDSINSKVVSKNITINGQEKIYAVTDTINLEDNISNINIGLKEKLIFDLQLSKFISRIAIQNSNGTKVYDYENDTLAKVEIHKKRLNGSLVVLEYTIKVKNNGEIAGYANNIVDYLASGLTFSSELNPDWYLLNNNLYTKKLAGEAINPGEEKEVKLILTKTMTQQNTGLVNNRAEICDSYNEYGEKDVNSTPNNNAINENDMGFADVIIMVATGAGTITLYIILLLVNTVLIFMAIKIMIKNKIIRIKKERR